MNFQLTQEQEMLVDSVRSFVEKELLPYETEVDRADEVSPELAAQIRGKAIAAGFYAFNMPEEVGGGGLDYLSQALIERELSKVSWALHVFVARPSKILMACTGEQINDYLLPCIQGEKIDCFALTEPGAGSDANAIKTRAVREGDDFVLNGSKHFISHAGHADFAIVFAVTDTYEHNGKKRNAVTSFLVDRNTPGMTIRRGPKCVSNRGYHTFEMFFDDCRVPANKVLGEVGKGWDVANAWLTAGRVMVAANCVGQAQRALDVSLQWAADRKQFGQAIGNFQGVSFKLADMATQIRAAELLTLHTAWKMDQGTMTDGEAGMAKLFASEVLGRAADEAVQIFGGMGLMDESPVERIWRNARIERVWEGTSEIQRHIISRELLRPLLR
ncbi:MULTISPECIES: acyl-CoA dehydrogenase family protein [Pseudomonas]|jgi:acyl-CoA dehydrogenase|uniref:acyl-CoA dehydrogenase family protein n=1 Tax=Pseudomonas TaxID=286 RepID=UPI0009824B98|nr:MULTISPECIES: acyl-CoA dehydrogenase family protein [Pseudomonas]MCK8656825.1 acyl-CoA dehydrogenase family protein [Pseudomonas umsongensis]NBB60925.1 acyl-CoA dehydrogenase [Pseudomonas sp. ODNR1LW]OMQ39441.1 acyl-CoA dehydrogenase [Pseudomonas putida]